MAYGLTNDLVFGAVCVAIAGYFIARRDLSPGSALLITLTKVGLVVYYFAWAFDGTWTYLDDMTYKRIATEMLRQGWNPITILGLQGQKQLIIAAGSYDILYYWWNMLAQSLFGVHYYSPVILNCLLTFISGYFFVRILEDLGFEQRYRQYFLMFFLLQWDVVVWSTFPNLKDVLVMTLEAGCLYFVIRLSRQFSIRALLGLIVFVHLLTMIRYYSPLLIFLAWGLWAIQNIKGRYKFAIITGLGLAFALILIPFIGELHHIKIRHMPVGAYYMLFTPPFWSVNRFPANSYMLIPAFMQTVMFFPVVFAGWLMWNRTSRGRIFIIYLVIGIMFYGSVPAVMGFRERFQFTTTIAWLQFHFLWWALGQVKQKWALSARRYRLRGTSPGETIAT